MFERSPVTERTARMAERIRRRVIQIDSERAAIITEFYKNHESIVPIIKRPMATLELCQKRTCIVDDDDVFVGGRSRYFCGVGVHCEWNGAGWAVPLVESGAWTLGEDGCYHNPDGEELRVKISQADYVALRSIRDFWKTRTISAVADAWQPDGYAEMASLGASAAGIGTPLIPMSPGHLTPGYARIIDDGYGAIRARAQTWLYEHYNNICGDDIYKELFYKAAVISCDAASTLIRRYGEACRAKAKLTEDSPRRAELLKMAASLEWLAENPARTFWEACQAALLYQCLLTLDSRTPATSLGRFDQYTWKYLKNDLENGTIDMDRAQELVDAFFLKANSYYSPPLPKIAQTAGIGNTYQHTTIGGVDQDTGEDASNPVTYMVLKAVGGLGLHDPTVSLRVNKNTPDALWECAIETSRRVGGLPLYQNDEVIIPGIIRELGFTLRDARDYSLIGCQEIVGSGNDYPAATGLPGASVHHGVVLTMALNNGTNPMNGISCRVKTGYLYDMTSIEEVRTAYERMNAYIMKARLSANHYNEYIMMHYAPLPVLSISMDGCMETGRDAVWGGCKYNSYGGTAACLGTVADSITAIKYMCFDKKLCTTREMYDAYMSNWEGREPLRQQILSEVPHYGNADPYADAEMRFAVESYYNVCRQCASARTPHFKAGLYGATDHINQGHTTWATPDGRKTGEPLADATSPGQGRDRSGPTAICVSAIAWDHSKFMNGMALNIKIHPSALSSTDGMDKLRDMTKAYFESGGMEIQFNVVSSETMRSAQADPLTYSNLVVRIAGYSAYFVELTRDGQNDLIRRTDNYI